MKRIVPIVATLALLAPLASPAHAADMKDMAGMKMDSGKSAEGKVHKGQGSVKRIDEKTGKINIAHGPIPSLKWSAMTMDFQVKDTAVLKGVKPGQNIEFDLMQAGPGQFVITRIAPAAKKK